MIKSRAGILGAILALLVGGALGALLLGGGGRTVTATATKTRTVVQVRTVQPLGIKASARRTATGHRREPPSGSAGPVAQALPNRSSGKDFSGTGPASLGTITLGSDSAISWTNSSGRFRLLFDGGGVGVDSTAPSGELFAPAGTYREVEVNSPGRWTLRLG